MDESTLTYNKQDFEKIIDFFHDGSLNRTLHEGNNLGLDISSFEFSDDWNEWGIKLNEYNCLEGTLILRDILRITKNDVDVHHYLQNRDGGAIWDFEITHDVVELGIAWWDCPTDETQPYSSFLITAEKILWIDRLNNLELDLTGIDTTGPKSDQQ